MRKIIVVTISVLYVLLALWTFANSFLPKTYPNGLLVITLGPFGFNLPAFLAFYAGMLMLRFNDTGRKLVVAFLSIGIIIKVISGLYVFFCLPENGGGLIMYYFEREMFRLENPYAYQAMHLVFITINLAVIVILSQKGTKRLFAPLDSDDATADRNDSGEVEVESDVLI